MLQQDKDCSLQQIDLSVAWPLAPPLSPDNGFESDRSLVSTASSVSSWSNRSEGSWWPCCGQCYRETRGHMKINLPVFKDEDVKDAVTYQIWWWDLTVYHWAGCWDCTLLPYAICSLQGYPGELLRSSGTDITLDDVLTILDDDYNNVKALDFWIKNCLSCKWGERRLCQTGVYVCQDTSKSWWHHSQSASLWAMWLS